MDKAFTTADHIHELTGRGPMPRAMDKSQGTGSTSPPNATSSLGSLPLNGFITMSSVQVEVCRGEHEK